MSHKKEVKFDWPASVPSTGGNYVRDKAGELALIEAEKPIKPQRKPKAKVIAVGLPASAPATEEGS